MDASALFDQIDSFGSRGDLINRLLDGYSEKFDFSFVNTGNLKTVYQLENEIIAREKEMKQQSSESKQELISMSKQLGEQIEEMRKQRQEEMNDKKEMIDQIPKIVCQEIEAMRKQHREEMEEMKKQHREEMDKRNEMIENLVKQFEAVQANYREELRKQNEDFNEKMKKINDKLDILMRPRITELFNGSHDGLISILGDDVTITSEKHDSPSIKTSNLRKYNDDPFDNNCGANSKSESDTIIMFDFGPYKRIDLHSYFIRTNRNSENGYHPKTWRIEGSNDSQSWKAIDSRSDDGSLNGRNKECNFICQHGSYGNVSNLFRYIRYIQQDNWNSNSSLKYTVYITYFDLFGSVVTI